MIAPLRGSAASVMRASNRSSIGRESSLAMSSRRFRRPANFLARRCLRRLFSIALFFAIKGLQFSASELWGSLPEREVELTEQGLGFRIGAGCRADRDVEPKHCSALGGVDFGGNAVLLHAERIIAATVEGLRIEAAEVANARQ